MSLLSRLAVQAARAYGILSSADKTKVVADYLVVAGGGAGSAAASGWLVGTAGGAGGLLTSTAILSTLNTYTVTVGAGGAGNSTGSGAAGANSVLSGTGLTTITAIGGGFGAHPGGTNGGNGGSGGSGAGSGSPGLGTAGQGNNAGTSANSGNYGQGGGGGASAVGGNGTTTTGGNGGAGTASSISGSSVTYAGGGGGGTYNGGTRGTGGAGGGGNGGDNPNGNGYSGTANLGGGGGGASSNAPTYAGGSGGSGIVIISYTSATPKFVGGTITTSGGKQIHTFTSSGTLSPLTPITASYLVVAGGGSGGTVHAGGGGAGGLLASSTTLYSGATYIVTVGAGGASQTSGDSNGFAGSNSVLSGTGLTTITATGGGLGGNSFPGANGGTGGSGGGGGRAGTGGAGTSGQGNNGGNGGGSGTTGGGGGGGAGAVGSNGGAQDGGAGGAGSASSITGTSTTYAGGGGGGIYTSNTGSPGAGGSGGGGAGGKGATTLYGTPGTQNTGGGGGGGGDRSGAGGSGIVIISYAGSQEFNGGLVTSSGGNTIHTFTSTGALTPLTNNLNNSLRFRSSASAYLSRTPTVAGNRKTWTWSAWVKLGNVTVRQEFFSAGSTPNSVFYDDLQGFGMDGVFSGTRTQRYTSAKYRDPSAWYHIVAVLDTTQATAANRMRMYVNGSQVALDVVGTGSYPAQDSTQEINNTVTHNIGRRSSVPDAYMDSYMTDINFIDGQALEPYYFGNNDANGVWKPIQYRGTYGTNGFYLNFSNTTSTTTLGYDSSPNGNNWTCNNISLTAGTTYDAMTDVPTNTSATVANYCVLNVLNKNTNVTVSNASLTSTSAVTNAGISGTMYIPSTGKYYWEATCTTKINYPIVGIANAAWNLSYPGATSGSYGYANDGLKYNNGSTASYGATYTSGDIIGVAFDADAGTLTFYKNNTSQGTAYTGLTDSYTPAISGQASDVWNMNFGQRPFSYTPPTGFVALNTYNLPTPTILQGNKYMDATTYTGTGTTNVVVNQAQFKPDLVWIKSRTTSGYNHYLNDSIRGAGLTLFSNLTNAEDSGSSTSFNSFNSNGFTVTQVTGWEFNNSSNNYVGWQWQAGQGTTSSNTSGSITSTVSVNTTAGFSVVTYTGTGANATVGHGLGVAPKFIIVKKRSAADPWVTYHVSLGVQYYTIINESSASYNNLANYWSATAPSSTVFGLNSYGGNNQSAATYVAYCWADVLGYSKAFSYTGNGSSDGPMVYLGFRPKFIMIKRTDTTGSWAIEDTARDSYNQAITALYPNQSIAETTIYDYRDFLSNGFKLRTSDSNTNASGGTYIGMAFAEHPFKNSNAR